jgi:hypothetical protein
MAIDEQFNPCNDLFYIEFSRSAIWGFTGTFVYGSNEVNSKRRGGLFQRNSNSSIRKAAQ